MKFSLIGSIKRLLLKLNCCNSQCFNKTINVLLDEEVERHIEERILQHIETHLKDTGYRITKI